MVKKLWGGNDIEAVPQRLDRLTLDEARATGAQTLQVVYGLVQDMKVVMDGEKPYFACCLLAVEHSYVQLSITSRSYVSWGGREYTRNREQDQQVRA
jgi:hypothetical protein